MIIWIRCIHHKMSFSTNLKIIVVYQVVTPHLQIQHLTNGSLNGNSSSSPTSGLSSSSVLTGGNSGVSGPINFTHKAHVDLILPVVILLDYQTLEKFITTFENH